jgi:hypothetical protein
MHWQKFQKLIMLIALSLRQPLADKDFSKKQRKKSGIGDIARYLNNMRVDAKDIAAIMARRFKVLERR